MRTRVSITEKPFICSSEKQSEANKALNSLISDSSDISDLSEYEEPENQPEAILSASRSTCSASGELVGRNCPLKQKNKDTTLPKKPKKDVAPKKVPKKSSAAFRNSRWGLVLPREGQSPNFFMHLKNRFRLCSIFNLLP
ncbi:hypothetical protein ABFA07_017245 [Porites harrisoni]